MENKDTLGQDLRKQDDDLLRDTTLSYGPEHYAENMGEVARNSWNKAKDAGRQAWRNTKEAAEEMSDETHDFWRRATDKD